MIVKRKACQLWGDCQFESSVISYDSKTGFYLMRHHSKFESSVISYDSKTWKRKRDFQNMFESSVISYDSKTTMALSYARPCLRVV